MDAEFTAIESREKNTFLTALDEVIRTPLYWVLIGIMLAYCGGIWLLGEALGKEAWISFFTYKNLIINSTVVFFTGLIFGRLFYIMLMRRPRRLFRAIGQDARDLVTWRRILHAVPLLIMFPIFFSAFTSFKVVLPMINPYQYDILFAKIDRWVHFGYDPWVLLQPAIGFVLVTFVINFIYKFWFFVKFMCLYWQGFSIKRPRLRAQFFLAYLLSWLINGTILALLLSSGGPCYYSFLTGDAGGDPYTGLFDYLRMANEHWPIWSLQSQQFLWEIYEGKHLHMMSGISAMPSMHVSVALMLLLVGLNYGPIARFFFWVFFIATLVGSVHLGWHYAIDGYLAIITTLIIWWVSGKIVDRYNLGRLPNDPVSSPDLATPAQKAAGLSPEA